MIKKLRLTLIAALLLIFSIQSTYADFVGFGAINPQNGFPLWYQDSNGVMLEIGLDPVYNDAAFDPVDPNNPFSVQIGFGSEAFYWLCSSTLGLRGGRTAVLTLGLEAAFANGEPVDGDQFVFTRIRIVLNPPVSGTYKITHPYGVDFISAKAGVRARFVLDKGSVSPNFTGALRSRVGPFLTPVDTNQPPGFIADINVTQTVKGSPFGTNYFRIDGPVGSNLDGVGNNFVQTDQFSISGKLYNAAVPTPLNIQRVTYRRTGLGSGIDVFANSVSPATVSFTGAGLPVTPMVGDGTDNFFGSHVLTDLSTLPAFVSVTAENPPNTPTTQNQSLVDVVTIAKAEYNPTVGSLTIMASSSDEVGPPTLTARGIGPLPNGNLVLSNILVPPANITVTSSAGGSDTEAVFINPQPVTGVFETVKADFRKRRSKWRIEGDYEYVGKVYDKTILTIHLGGLDGPVIGTVISPKNGLWEFEKRRSKIIPKKGDTISVASSRGATMVGIPIKIRK